MPFTTIIFDLGNVVLTNDWHFDCPEKDKEFSEAYGISSDEMDQAGNAFWPKYKMGLLTEDEFWELVLKKSGSNNTDPEKAKLLYLKYQGIIEEMPQLIKKLKKNNSICSLTNKGKEWIEFKTRKFHLNDLFDVIITSCHEGIAKPDREIYKILLKKMNIQPQNCIFVDDHKRNLVPAAQLGMKTILFSNQKELEKELRQIGILF